MLQYTTGDMARLCGVSVRTVQFYDTRNLLPPSALSEGGRRLYSEADLSRLRLICLLKSLGLSLDSIQGILESESPDKVLLCLLDEQIKQLDGHLEDLREQRKTVQAMRESIRGGLITSVNSICDIERMMNGRKKLKKTYTVLLVGGILMDVAQIGAILLWIFKGIWWPFVVAMPFVILAAFLLLRMYYRNTAYICPECGAKFKPGVKDFFFAAHTSKARKLTCTACGYKGYCVETYAQEGEDPTCSA